MGERNTHQDIIRVKQKLVTENVKRVLYTAIVSAIIVPIMMLIYKFFPVTEEITGALKTFLIGYEFISIAYAVLSYLTLRNRDKGMQKLIYRSFWGFFAAFSFGIIYSDTLSGNELIYYGIMLSALLLIPYMSLMEQMYYVVIEMVYAIFLYTRFGITGKTIFDVILLNGILLFVSRMIYNKQMEHLLLREYLKNMKDKGTIDPLTAMPNRKNTEKVIYGSLNDCIRSRRRISVILADIDDLGKYNNEYGKERGDECIKLISQIVRKAAARSTDIICRTDGGRFLIYMEGGSDMEPVSLAEKIRTAVAFKGLHQGRGAILPYVSISLGVASTIPRRESDFAEIYDEAEEALNEAKDRGKNIIIYDEQVYGRDVRKAN